MDAPFHIFEVDPDGTLRWREAAPTLSDATTRAEALADSQRHAHVVIDKRTGTTIYIAPNSGR
jgi:hypothetical protein